MSEFHSNSLQLTSYYLYLLQDKIPRLENTEFLSRHMPAALSISKSAVCLFAKSIFFWDACAYQNRDTIRGKFVIYVHCICTHTIIWLFECNKMIEFLFFVGWHSMGFGWMNEQWFHDLPKAEVEKQEVRWQFVHINTTTCQLRKKEYFNCTI